MESYIGISGAVVKPRLYISMVVSARFSMFGIRDANLIVAIDTMRRLRYSRLPITES